MLISNTSVTCLITIFSSFFVHEDKNSTTENNLIKYQTSHFTIKQDSIKEILLSKDFILGKIDYTKNDAFTKVDYTYASKTIYLNTETYNAFINMFNQASSEGISLKILSGTRNFYEQKHIWERKWEKLKNLEPTKRALKILEYSSMPSTSRHHWGTDVDLNSLRNSYFEYGDGKKEYEWLVNNAHKHGFYQVYTSKQSGRTGYSLERWHWSYMPLASKYLDYYNNHITYQDIAGFKGAELTENLNIITNFVNGISEEAKNATITN